MTTPFSMTRDINGYNGFGLPFQLNVLANFQGQLTANVAQSITIPELENYSIFIAIFSYSSGSTVWVANNSTATIPSGAFATTASQLNPAARRVKSGDVLSLITSDSTNDQVGVSLYALFYPG